MLQVCVSASDQDLATTGDVMQIVFGATTTAMVQTTGEINYLGTLVARASAWAERTLGYPLALQTYSESLRAHGGRALMVSRTPLVTVLRLFDSTATCEATALCSSEYVIEDRDAGLVARDQGFGWTQIERSGVGDFNLGLTGFLQPGLERRPWLIEYVAGYKLAASTSTCHGTSTGDEAWTTGATLPEDIRQAVALKAAELQANPFGVRSRRVGDLAVEYATEGPSGAAALLDPYRRII